MLSLGLFEIVSYGIGALGIGLCEASRVDNKWYKIIGNGIVGDLDGWNDGFVGWIVGLIVVGLVGCTGGSNGALVGLYVGCKVGLVTKKLSKIWDFILVKYLDVYLEI